jgi:hypothetical protein
MKSKLLWILVSVLLGIGSLSRAVEIASVTAQVVDETYGEVLAEGGPWAWTPDAVGTITGLLPEDCRSILVFGFDDGGNLVATGQLANVSIFSGGPFGEGGTLDFFPDPAGIFVLMNGFLGLGTIELHYLEIQALAVTVDIKPGSPVNPVNVISRGVLPVVIAGSAAVDVRQIDVASLALAGVAPRRYCVADVETEATLRLRPDGYPDLILHFRTEAIVAVLGEVANREVVTLELTGALTDGTPITGSDILTVLAPCKKDKPTPKKGKK